MRSAIRVLAFWSVAALVASLTLGQGGVAATAQPHGITVPAQVSASNWTTMPSAVTANATNTDTGVSCVTSVFCMAVGNQGETLTNISEAELWNGTTWSPLPMPTVPNATSSFLTSVSCVTTSFCIASGGANISGTLTSLMEEWNGNAWTVQATGAPLSIDPGGVSCASRTFCMTVGRSGVDPYGFQWNGTAWTPTSLVLPSGFADAGLSDVSCVTPSACMAVGLGEPQGGGQYLPVAEQWNGSAWTATTFPAPTLPTDYALDSVSCAGPSFCAAAGSSGITNVVMTWNGASWANATVPTPSGGGFLNGVSCFSATSCTAVGSAGPTYEGTQALTWNGQTWAEASTPHPPSPAQGSDLLAVDCVTNWACVAAGGAVIINGSNHTFLPFDLIAPIARSGYRFVASDGGIFNYGPGAPFLGSMGGTALNAPIVAMATMPAGDGYYLVASDGGIFNFGSAQFYGSMGGTHLNKPIVGMAVTPDGAGYWLVASDGGIFAFGDAVFYGSTGNLSLNKPVVGMATTPNGNGYYLVASDGGIFAFPSGPSGLPFYGSTGATTLNKPIVGMAVTPAGQYYLVASDGGIFAFPSGPGGPAFYGSTGALTLNKPVIGMSVANGGTGYYLGASDGGIFSFPSGNAGPTFYGSRGGQPLNKPIVGIAG